MLRKILKNAGILILCWVLAMLLYSLLYRVRQPGLLLQIFVIPAAFFFLAGILFTIMEINTKVLRRLSIVFIFSAIAVDQAIKIYLFSLNWDDINIPLILPAFHIIPTHNTLGSYLWVLLDWKGASNLLNVFLVLLLMPFFVEFWRFYRAERRNSLWINLFVNLIVAGALCNIIDNLFHGGSLDYLYIRPFYTTDLKDIYISLALMCMVIEVFENKLYRKDSNINKDFNSFLSNDLRKLFRRITGKG